MAMIWVWTGHLVPSQDSGTVAAAGGDGGRFWCRWWSCWVGGLRRQGLLMESVVWETQGLRRGQESI